MQTNKENITDKPKDLLETLFKEAEQKGGLQYIFTLLRVTGITNRKDPLLKLEEILKAKDFSSEESDLAKEPFLFDSIEESLSLIGNLLNCISGKVYKICFFRPHYIGTFPNIKKPSVEKMFNEIHQHSINTNYSKIADFLDHKFFTYLLGQNVLGQQDFEMAKSFLLDLIDICKSQRFKFKNNPRFYMLPRFEVLELIVDDLNGLFGLRIHFSNGSNAEFLRHENSTTSVNIQVGRSSEVGFFAGDLDALTEEWKIGKKQLYEIGLPGRYNELGKWKPLIYPQRKSKIIDHFEEKVRSLSDDEQVQGILLYIMCTAHQAIEFVVKSDMDLPWDNTTIGKVMHMYKCPEQTMFQNIRIYDGTYYLNSCKPEDIEMGIAQINLTLNTIAFTYNATLNWRLKYNMLHSHAGFAKIEEKDLNILTSILEKYPRNTDSIILNSAIDWYIRGISSKDAFAKFLCYYRVVEMIVTSIYRGESNFNLGFKKTAKCDSDQKSLECIEKKHAELYEKDKLRFVTAAYDECIRGTKHRTKQVLQYVFGKGHKYIDDLFESPKDCTGSSLYEIRNKIAHGNITLLDKENVKLVRSRLWHIQNIAQELIIRLICSVKPSEELPKWSEVRGMAMGTDDPRTCLITNNENMFSKGTDWTIKPEWCS